MALAAGFSRKTVYNYFLNKAGLIAEVIFDEARRVNARASRNRPDPGARQGRSKPALTWSFI